MLYTHLLITIFKNSKINPISPHRFPESIHWGETKLVASTSNLTKFLNLLTLSWQKVLVVFIFAAIGGVKSKKVVFAGVWDRFVPASQKVDFCEAVLNNSRTRSEDRPHKIGVLFQSVSICFNVFQSVSNCFNLFQSVSMRFNVFQCVSMCFNPFIRLGNQLFRVYVSPWDISTFIH